MEDLSISYAVDAFEANPLAIPSIDEMYRLEEALQTAPQIDFRLINRFADGLYARQVTMQRGALVTTQVHLKQHFAFVLTGEISVWTDQGYQRIKAPQVLVTEPGTKRVLYVHEETTWITVHASNARTQQEAEAELVCNDPEMIERARQACHSG
jgi:quercetin dioxygenase-like cupin family protein